MKRRIFPIVLSLGAIAFFGVMWWLMHDKNLAILNPKGQIAEQQKDLIIFTTGLGMLVIIPVFVLLFTFIWKYRASNTQATYTPNDDGNRFLEAVWWGIPIIIIIILSVVTWITTHQLDPYRALDSNKKPLHVQVVALQWRWLFLYPEQKVASINELRIPANRPVEFSISADAPMSAFWIPNLGGQTYAMNGMTSKLHLEADASGEYRGSNSNISGEGYADMNFNVIATDDTTFDSWATKLAVSSNSLDWNAYQKLAAASKNKDIQYFALNDEDLYKTIMNKYMSHSDHAATMEDDMESMNHSSMNHEGMY